MTKVNSSKHISSKPSTKRSARKVHTLPLATTAALLTAATCLGGQPAMAAPATTITTPTQAATAKKLANGTGAVYKDREYVPLGEKKPWLQYPNILEFRRLRGRNSDATEIKSDEEGSDSKWKAVNDKTAMYAHVETRGNSDYLVFDIFFNNNAKSMVDKSNKQWYLWQVPYAIADLDSNGLYKSDTVTNLRYDAYRPKKDGHILSQDPEAFEKDDSLSFSVPNMQQTDKHYGKKGYALYQVGIGLNPGDKLYTDLNQIFHKNESEPLISRMAGDQATYAYYNGSQYNKNYGLGITVAKPYDNVAYHMHAELKLRPGAINKNAGNYNDKYANIQNAWTWANSGSWGKTTSSAYTVISGRDPNNDEDKDGKLKRNKTDSTAPKIYHSKTEIANDTQTIKLNEGDKLSFTTTDNKGRIEKFSISGLTDTPKTKQGTGSEDKPLSSDEIAVTNDMNGKEVTITSEDGSGNVTTRKVKVEVAEKKKLADEHPLTGKTITTTVGEKLPKLTEIDNFVTVANGAKLDKKPTLKWGGVTTPKTNTVGTFTHDITGTYSDSSTSTATVTINVKPKKPVIDTNLTNLAGKKGQKVTVSVGDGIPTDATTKVKLFDKDNKEIGSTTTIKNGKAEITVNGEIPEGDVYATTTVTKPKKQEGQTTTPGFDLTSENSDKKQATKPKDNEKPTITATTTSSSVTVGQDLKIHIVAKDDVKVEEVPNAQALMQGLGLEINELSSRIESSQTTNTDKEKDFDLTVKNMQPKEVGTHTLTFTVTDSSGKTGTVKLTITVKPAAPTITVPADGKDQGSATITPAADTDTLVITYTPEGGDTTKTITVKKGGDGNWTGENIPDGVKVDTATGKVTIPADKVKDGSDVKAKDSKNGIESKENTGKTGTNPTKPDAPAITTPADGKDQGSATITPAKDTDTLEITYTPEGDNKEKTITVKKGGDGNWTGENIPDGVKVDTATGKVTIPADKVKDGSDVKAKDSKNGIESKENTGKTGTNPAEKPAVSDQKAENKTGKDKTTVSGKTTPGATVTIKKDGKEVGKVTAKDDGTFTVDIDKQDPNTKLTLTPSKDGVDGDPVETTVTDETPAAKPTVSDPKAENKTGKDKTTVSGKTTPGATVTIKKDGKEVGKVTAKDDGTFTVDIDKQDPNTKLTLTPSKDGVDGDPVETTVTDETPAAEKPAVPTITPQNDGSVEVTPADGTDTLEITYTPEGDTNEKTITVKKGNDGNWTGENIPEGVTVDKTTGKVTIPADKVKDGSDVKAKDTKGDNSSDETTATAGNNGNSGSGTGSDSGSETGNSETGDSNNSGSDSGNDSTPNNGGPASGSTTGGSSSTDSGAQNSTNGSSDADNANIPGNASTGASGSNASTKPGNKVSAKHFSQLVKTDDEVGQAGLISAIVGALGAATAFFSRKKKRQ